MNTPKPCDSCKHLYVDALSKDDPSYQTECLEEHHKWYGKLDCPFYTIDERLEKKEEKQTEKSSFYPKWEDHHGNIMILTAKNHVFDSYIEAQEFQIANFLWYIPFGLKTSGILELTSSRRITYCEATLGMLGKVALLEGPEFEMSLSKEGLN